MRPSTPAISKPTHHAPRQACELMLWRGRSVRSNDRIRMKPAPDGREGDSPAPDGIDRPEQASGRGRGSGASGAP
jgi:hypothetical protein